MTHFPIVERVAWLTEYFVGPDRKLIAEVRGRSRSRRIRCATRSATRELRHVDVRCVSTADFSDPESQRVLDAIADALIAPLAIQQAREDHVRWLASQQVYK
jgi:hypothetical protein